MWHPERDSASCNLSLSQRPFSLASSPSPPSPRQRQRHGSRCPSGVISPMVPLLSSPTPPQRWLLSPCCCCSCGDGPLLQAAATRRWPPPSLKLWWLLPLPQAAGGGSRRWWWLLALHQFTAVVAPPYSSTCSGVDLGGVECGSSLSLKLWQRQCSSFSLKLLRQRWLLPLHQAVAVLI
jgi:hypothetical protein